MDLSYSLSKPCKWPSWHPGAVSSTNYWVWMMRYVFLSAQNLLLLNFKVFLSSNLIFNYSISTPPFTLTRRNPRWLTWERETEVHNFLYSISNFIYIYRVFLEGGGSFQKKSANILAFPHRDVAPIIPWQFFGLPLSASFPKLTIHVFGWEETRFDGNGLTTLWFDSLVLFLNLGRCVLQLCHGRACSLQSLSCSHWDPQ